MKLSDYDAYFKDLSSRMASIAHTEEDPRFGHYNLEEVLLGLRSKLDLTGFCLLLEDPTGQFYKVANEQIKDLQTGAILIIKHVPLDDFAEERIALDRALQLCRQVAARMLEDQILAINTDTKPRFLRGLQIAGFQYQKASNVFDNCFGYRLEFQYLDTEPLTLIPEEWIT